MVCLNLDQIVQEEKRAGPSHPKYWMIIDGTGLPPGRGKFSGAAHLFTFTVHHPHHSVFMWLTKLDRT